MIKGADLMTGFSRLLLSVLVSGAFACREKPGQHPGVLVLSAEVRAYSADCADYCVCDDTFLPAAFAADGPTREQYMAQFAALYDLPISQARVLQGKGCPVAHAFGYCEHAVPRSAPLPVTVRRYYYSNRYPQNQAMAECQASGGRFVNSVD